MGKTKHDCLSPEPVSFSALELGVALYNGMYVPVWSPE